MVIYNRVVSFRIVENSTCPFILPLHCVERGTSLPPGAQTTKGLRSHTYRERYTRFMVCRSSLLQLYESIRASKFLVLVILIHRSLWHSSILHSFNTQTNNNNLNVIISICQLVEIATHANDTNLRSIPDQPSQWH